MRTNRFPVLLAALALAGSSAGAVALPTAAHAAIPTLQNATFKVSLRATQTTSWSREPMGSIADCSPIVRFSGRGTEQVSVTLKPAKFTAWRTAGEVTFLGDPGKDGFGINTAMKIARNGVEQAEEVAGSCMGNPGRVTSTGPYDCGSKRNNVSPSITLAGGRVRLKLGDGLPAPLISPKFRTCPAYANPAVELNGITEIPSLEKIAAGELFGTFRQHILLARRTFKLSGGGYRGTTTVAWEITLTRTGAVR
ncbi:hypothetical protein VSS74_05155 [Conexibacter stalactiti]|uniref:Uncharacterized protein n=1 Tax=Conexibacter stalactiti TaxID=1940611 RepID=A0ABU4HK79_9ACTN|nr:hypothetical protein [Conexibacter stalactiti]MDW5593710.1 hypothetical protein [Conexibacter stalactiti]MEC5034351.1 hypothetical protein [Conexibacter stalactiti]